MSVGNRIAKSMDRIYDRMRDPAAFRIRADDAASGDFDGLRGARYAVVVTFRRNGQSVPSPVWFGVDTKGRLYLQTPRDSGKVKRIRNDPRVLVAPSNARGKPKGPVLTGRARVLSKDEWSYAELTLAASYGVGRKIYEATLRIPEELMAYVEISPLASP
jgi:PPOX class probable F420-dependent enzyme